MAMSYGKYVAYRIVNALIILFFATLLSASLFVQLAIVEDKGLVQAQLTQQIQTYVKRHHTQPTQEWIQKLNQSLIHQYKLDVPYWKRVLETTKNTILWRWGSSQSALFGTYDVRKQIEIALPRTILMFTTATVIVILIGIALGVKSAQNPGSYMDRTIAILSMVTTSLPMWWLGMLMILIFCVWLGILPIKLYTTPRITSTIQLLKKMSLPVFTIVLNVFGAWAWTIRNIMIGVLQEDFIMAARAKGVPENKVIYGHALKAAAPPIVTMIIFAMLGSLSGAIITEIIFNWPGMGLLYWQALMSNVITTVMALTYISILLYLVSMILADLLYGWLDPRVRVGAAGSR